MEFLEQNIKGICAKFGLDYYAFLADFQAETVHDLSLGDLEALVEEYELDLQAVMFKPLFKNEFIHEKLDRIKLLILDVDGVMTDGGMYFTESGDQFKKFNTKDGMAIIHLTKAGVQVGIISSGFKGEAVKTRAEMLGIQHVYVGRDNKLQILKNWCETLAISLDEVAMIGDDINDLEVMNVIGFKTCPADAMEVVKKTVDLVLSKKGGEGCVREFIDNYFLSQPLGY
jgi:YrbI family 3-deoxy-D-manno-octulosonate 8-phosphate phosphatase